MMNEVTKLHSFIQTDGKEVAWIQMHEHEVTRQIGNDEPFNEIRQDLFLKVKGLYSTTTDSFLSVDQAKRWFKRTYGYKKEEGRWHKLKQNG